LENDSKEKVDLEKYSIFFNQFKGHINLFRIYTWPEYRKEITEAALKLLGNPF
jgi:hypothetical protein